MKIFEKTSRFSGLSIFPSETMGHAYLAAVTNANNTEQGHWRSARPLCSEREIKMTLKIPLVKRLGRVEQKVRMFVTWHLSCTKPIRLNTMSGQCTTGISLLCSCSRFLCSKNDTIMLQNIENNPYNVPLCTQRECIRDTPHQWWCHLFNGFTVTVFEMLSVHNLDEQRMVFKTFWCTDRVCSLLSFILVLHLLILIIDSMWHEKVVSKQSTSLRESG